MKLRTSTLAAGVLATIATLCTGISAIATPPPANSESNGLSTGLKECVNNALSRDKSTPVTDSDLQSLDFLTCGDLDSLAGLDKATNLLGIRIDGGQVSDLAPLSGLNKLKSLNISACEVSDLSPLAGLPNLTDIRLAANKISDLTPLSSRSNLHILFLFNNPQITDLSPLANLHELQKLQIGDTGVTSLAPLENVRSLEALDISGLKISDISPLKGLNNLKLLNLDNTQVSNFNSISEVISNLDITYSDNDMGNSGYSKLEVIADGAGYAENPFIAVPGFPLYFRAEHSENVTEENGKLKLADGVNQGTARFSGQNSNGWHYGGIVTVKRNPNPSEHTISYNPKITITEGTLTPGSSDIRGATMIKIKATGFPPNSEITFTIPGESIILGKGKTDSTGSVLKEIYIPGKVYPGNQQIKANVSNTEASIPVTVHRPIPTPHRADSWWWNDLPEIHPIQGSPGLAANQVYVGDTITVEATGFKPNQYVDFELHSSPVHLGRVLANQYGTARIKTRIPANTVPGLHHIWGIQGSTVTKTPIWVLKKGTGYTGKPGKGHGTGKGTGKGYGQGLSPRHGKGHHGLANTGTQAGTLLVANSLLTLAGAALIITRRSQAKKQN